MKTVIDLLVFCAAQGCEMTVSFNGTLPAVSIRQNIAGTVIGDQVGFGSLNEKIVEHGLDRMTEMFVYRKKELLNKLNEGSTTNSNSEV